jgi:ABC-type bacteriocin/lantibiotic exporter with double-glycine peptidase domain
VKLFALRFGWICVVAAAAGCSTYTGSAKTLQPRELRKETGWLAVEGVPLLRQADEHDCGPTALSMVLAYWQPKQPRALDALPKDRKVTVKELRDFARSRGFTAFVVAGKPDDLVYELDHGRPAIVGVAKSTVQGTVTHYEVVVGMHRDSRRVATLDPAAGWRQNSFAGFLSEWEATGRVLLVLVPKTAGSEAARVPTSAASAP